MTGLVMVHDRDALERFFRRDTALNVYQLADLDPWFWPQTCWYGWAPDAQLEAVALLYTGGAPPALLLLAQPDDPAPARLLDALSGVLPRRFQAHLQPGLVSRLRGWQVHSRGRHLKMVLVDPAAVQPDPLVESLDTAHLDLVQDLYARAYPDNWFDPRMLGTGAYVGIREGEQLVCVAGVHTLSSVQRVAALGNITTDPAFRGRGLARRATGALCSRLLDKVDTIGLNVKDDNAAALSVYERLGFEVVAAYQEIEASAGSAAMKSP